jgi:hypothetical protein
MINWHIEEDLLAEDQKRKFREKVKGQVHLRLMSSEGCACPEKAK